MSDMTEAIEKLNDSDDGDDDFGKDLRSVVVRDENDIPGFISQAIGSKPSALRSRPISQVKLGDRTSSSSRVRSKPIGQRMANWIQEAEQSLSPNKSPVRTRQAKQEDSEISRRDTLKADQIGEISDRLTRNLRIMQKKAVYGKLERGGNNNVPMTRDYRFTLLDQLDRVSTEVPEPMKVLLTRELLPVVELMYKEYSRHLGPRKQVAKLARRRLLDMIQFSGVEVPSGTFNGGTQ